MKTRLIAKFLSAIVLLAIFMVNMIWWFRVTNRNTSFEADRAEYLAAFPASLQNPLLLTLMAIILLTISGILFVQSGKLKQLKVVSVVGYCTSFILAFWQLFTIM
ncbi:hypothetical protein [Pedobacter sp.]|uniref:hypothetical protein n=1 Tax=Pedobacter sp. TaxID=1411316 RepID=UPI003BAB2232